MQVRVASIWRTWRSRERLQAGLIALYLLLLPVQFPTGIGAFNLAPSDIVLALYLLLWVVGVTRLRQRHGCWSRWHIGIICAFVIGTLLWLFNGETAARYVFLNKDIGLLSLFAGYAMLTTFAISWARVRWMAMIFVIGVVVQSLVALWAFGTGMTTGATVLPGLNYGSGEGMRLAGALIDPNAFGGLIALAFVLQLVVGASSDSRPAIIWNSVASLTLFTGIILTFSRSTWIAIGATLPIIFITRPRVLLRLAAMAVLAYVLIIGFLGRDYLAVTQFMATRQSGMNIRMDTMLAALPYFLANPAFGAGIGIVLERTGSIIHNTPVWFLYEMGLFGLIMFAGLVVWYFQRGYAAWRYAPSSERSLVLALVCGHLVLLVLSLGIEAFYQRHWWFVMAMLASSYALTRRQTAPPTDTARMPAAI
jgi:O-antigen ligase